MAFSRMAPRIVRGTFLNVLEHDCLNIAQSTAYSAIVALFPALIVAAAIINLLPNTAPLRFQLAVFFERVLPPGVTPLFAIAFDNTPHAHSVKAMLSASLVSFLGASNVIATLMEGLRRAQDQRRDSWTFWQRRLRSFKLVPLAFAPMALASLLLVFGHAATGWLARSLGPEVRAAFFAVALLIRWVIALGASVGVIALIYHAGIAQDEEGITDEADVAGRQAQSRSSVPLESQQAQPALLAKVSWPETAQARAGRVLGALDEHVFSQVPLIRATLPGATMATLLWFATTLLFGWYVTRFANYSEVYGSLGAGIALLFWLYIVSLSVLCGAEFNAQLDRVRAAELKSYAKLQPLRPEDTSSK